MYRLLSLGLTSLRKPYGLSSPLNIKNNKFEVRDPAKLFYELAPPCIECSRLRSTVTNPNTTHNKVRKKRSKSYKKYYDLLAVTDLATKQQTMSVQKLTWSDLKLLANTNLNLSELHKLKSLSKSNAHIEEHTYNNLTVIDCIPSTASADVFNNEPDTSVITCNIPSSPPTIELATTTLSEEDELDTIPIVNSFHPEEADEPLEEAEAVEVNESGIKTTGDSRARLEIAEKILASFMEVCSNLKTPNKGVLALIFHNSRATRGRDKDFQLIQNIKIYNSLMKGFAANGDFNKLQEIVKIIKKENVALDLQSYITIFECLGRVNVQNKYLKEIRIYVKEALHNGFTFNRMLNEGTFLNDEKSAVLKVMTSYDPSFTPKYLEPRVQYDNHLLNHLNDDKQLHQPKNVNYVDNGGLFTPESLKLAIKEQLELEKRGHIEIKSIALKGKVNSDVETYRQVLESHYRYWEETALVAFNRDLHALTAQRSPLNFETYMRVLPAKEYISIIVDEARKLAEGSETYSPSANQLYRDLGNKVYTRYMVLRKQKTGVLDKVIKIHNKYCESYAGQHEHLDILPSKFELLNSRQQWQWMEYDLKSSGATLTMDHREWPPPIKQSIGKFLYRIVMHDIKIDVNAMRSSTKHKNYLPAFYTIFRHQGRAIKEEVKPHPVLSRLYRAALPEILRFPPYEVPMVCPPVPWTSVDSGGYLISPCDVVRLPQQATSQKQRLSEADPVQLYPSLDALNQLANVPWKVNTDILDVILDVFIKGGSRKLDVPESPSSLSPPPAITQDMDKNQKYKAFRQRLQFKRKKAEMYSLWCDCLYRLSLANHFRNNVFWLPHNMDFRGRVYPVPPHFNHLGSDLARSMLIFAEARPLGPEGLDWLKLHLINLTGLKKRDSVADRLKYANEIIDDILDSADNPLNGKMWWVQSDEPWQTLACCMEIAKAMRSPDPEQYRSQFPIHQDGSCNGLQHYAALGRDSAGAYSVNLCRSSIPQDVYSAVVSLVEEQRKQDAANGLEVAKALEGFVKRKVIKQTIMTTVYGVTRYGAKLQIARQLKDIDNFPKESVWSASSYLTSRTFDSLRSMFTSTREIQDWFTDCARLISAVGGQHVEWVTPMGLPIVQPYFKYKSLNAAMKSTTRVYKPFHMDKYQKPNVMKQKNAFPPNFIHSLDSSHMMLTSLHCERAGITFVSVHDCYWTHPSTVHIMNKICREQFVALHSEPILENLSLFLSEKYSYDNNQLTGDGSVTDLTRKKLNRVLRHLPKTGDFDINQVLQSTYFFS